MIGRHYPATPSKQLLTCPNHTPLPNTPLIRLCPTESTLPRGQKVLPVPYQYFLRNGEKIVRANLSRTYVLSITTEAHLHNRITELSEQSQSSSFIYPSLSSIVLPPDRNRFRWKQRSFHCDQAGSHNQRNKDKATQSDRNRADRTHNESNNFEKDRRQWAETTRLLRRTQSPINKASSFLFLLSNDGHKEWCTPHPRSHSLVLKAVFTRGVFWFFADQISEIVSYAAASNFYAEVRDMLR